MMSNPSLTFMIHEYILYFSSVFVVVIVDRFTFAWHWSMYAVDLYRGCVRAFEFWEYPSILLLSWSNPPQCPILAMLILFVIDTSFRGTT